MTGFYSGLLEGMRGTSELQANQDVHQERMQQMMVTDFELKQKQLAYATQEQEKKLLANAFSSQSYDKSAKQDSNSTISLATKFMQAGQRLMGIDPAKGLSLIKEGEDLQHKAAEDEQKSLTMATVKHEALANITAGVSDQSSLNEAVNDLSKAGIVIPPKYRVWNEETKVWLEQKAKGSKTAKETAELDLRVKAAELAKKKEERQAEKDKNKANLEERKFAFLKENKEATSHSKPYKDPTADKLDALMPDLVDNEDFADLPKKERAAVLNDYARRAYFHQTEGITDPATAYEMAKEEVTSRIKDGKYEGFKVDALTGKTKEPEGDVATKFKNDPAVKGYSLGSKTNQGYEVKDSKGNIVGYYN